MITRTRKPVIDLLWFHDCPNHQKAEAMIREIAEELGFEPDIRRIEVPDSETGCRVRFPGSPTVRVNGIDIEPGFADCEECEPRCRVYVTSDGLRGLPEREWLVLSLAGAVS